MTLPATDTFTDTNGVQLATHNNAWVVNNSGITADFDIQGNALAADGDGANFDDYYFAHWTGDTFSDNQYAQGTFLSSGADYRFVGVAVRVASGTTITGYDYSGNTYGDDGDRWIDRIVDRVITTLAIYTVGPVNGDVMRIEANGTTITPKRNGSLDASLGAQTDASISSGSAGVSGYNVGSVNTLGDWEGGNLAGAAFIARTNNPINQAVNRAAVI